MQKKKKVVWTDKCYTLNLSRDTSNMIALSLRSQGDYIIHMHLASRPRVWYTLQKI